MTISALVVGLGAQGQRHARNLRALLGNDLELSALRSRRAGKVITDDLTIGGGHPEDDCNGGVFTDLAAALAPRPDLVMVCTPSALHVPVAHAAVAAGAAVFVEAPLSNDLRGVGDLRRLAAARRAIVAVGCQLRFHPALRRLRRLLEQDMVGRLVAVQVEEGDFLPSRYPYEDHRTSVAARAELGGGVILSQLHQLDYVHWLFGLPLAVFAVGGQLGSLDVEVEDTASALFQHEVDGRPLPVHVHLDALQQQPRRTCRVIGEDGTIAVDLDRPSLTWTASDGTVLEHYEFPGFEAAQLYTDELVGFLGCALDGGTPDVGLDHATATLRLALAMRRSIDHGTLEPLA